MPHSRKLGRLASNLVQDVRGSVFILFALALPVLLALVGGALDYGFMILQKSKLQDVSDAAVVAAARELHLANADTGSLQSVVQAVVSAHLGEAASSVHIATKSMNDPLSVEVDLRQDADGFFISQFKDSVVTARSVAYVSGGTPLCVLSLGKLLSGAISLESNARLTGNGCAVYSNSILPNGISSKGSAQLHAGLICSVGGMVGGTGNYQPQPLTDCPPIEDPLAGRPAPPAGSCTTTNLKIGVPQSYQAGTVRQTTGLLNETVTESALTKSLELKDRPRDQFTEETVTLSPGVYCGGLIIGGATNVKLLPGTYVMKNGPLYVADYAVIEGEFVGVYFTGLQSTLYLGANTQVTLKAPKDGPMAGLLFYQDRDALPLQTFSILSDNARVLEGTLYLPKAYLTIDADQPIADQSAYTAIITLRMALFAGPNVVLNTNYDQTEVPVPAGIAQDREIVLSQ